MRKVNLLIANSERRLTNLIESLVLDACYEQAFVDPTRIERADELVKLATSSAYKLIIVAATIGATKFNKRRISYRERSCFP